MIGIVFAMEEELSSFLKKRKILSKKKIYELEFYTVEFENLQLILVESGVGKVNAARSTQVLIDHFSVQVLLAVGVAGGISERVKVLDVVIGEKLIQYDFDITSFNHPKGYVPKVGVSLESDKRFVQLAIKASNNQKITSLKGTVLSGDKFCSNVSERKQLGVEWNALCVEMEGASVAQVAYLSGIPFLVLRSISDSIEQNSVFSYDEFLLQSCEQISFFLEEFLKQFQKEKLL